MSSNNSRSSGSKKNNSGKKPNRNGRPEASDKIVKKPDEVKSEKLKKEAEAAEGEKKLKTEETKTEKTKTEEAKTEEAKTEETKTEAAAEGEANAQANAPKSDEELLEKQETVGKPDKKDQMIEELQDRLRRSLAEFDNFRKRTEKEKSQMFDMGVKSMLEKILPVVDNFERGLGTLNEKELEDGFALGMNNTYKQLLKTMEDMGVETIETVGKEFDPNLHNAVMHEDNEEFGENTVSQEFQKGYIYHGTVVRHSMVKVAN